MSATTPLWWVLRVGGRAVKTGTVEAFSGASLMSLIAHVVAVSDLGYTVMPTCIHAHERAPHYSISSKMRYYGATKWAGNGASTRIWDVLRPNDVLTVNC
jgi:hypothetical protein